jgi:hypothetical protein
MSNTDDSLQVILEEILSEYGDISEKAVGSAEEGESEEIREIMSKSADALLKRLKLRAVDKLEAVREIEKEFEAAVLRTWKKPLDLLDLLLYLSLEVASDFNSERGSKTSKHDYVRRALVRQQAKACLVFNEMGHLLRSGFPSGAHLHWKTLHEITCVSYFVSKYGEDMAKRFLDYEVVERYFQAEALLEHQQKIGYETSSEREFEVVKKEFSKIRKSYGLDFVKKANYPYGWVPRKVLKTRSLREIEKSVDLDMLRPFYDLARYNVHGGPEGLIFKPAFIKNERKSAFIPLGPSNYGLADPGKIAAISLGQVTACLLLSESTVKRLIIVEALRNLVDEISDAFHEIQAEFGRDSKTLNPPA